MAKRKVKLKRKAKRVAGKRKGKSKGKHARIRKIASKKNRESKKKNFLRVKKLKKIPKQRRINTLSINYALFLLLIAVIIGISILLKPSYIGLTVYEVSQNIKNWSFDSPSDYIYDTNLINLSNGEVKLIAVKNISIWTQTTDADFKNGTFSKINYSANSLKLNIKSDWWDSNYKYRKKLTVTNNAASAISDYSVKLILDTQTLVASNKLKSNCDDLRLVYFDGITSTELDIINELCNSASTEIWFKIKNSINANSAGSNYYLYYGNPSAINPPSNRNSIYLKWDDFSTNTLSNYQLGNWLCYHGSCNNFMNLSYDNGRILFNTTNDHDSGLRLGLNQKDVYAKVTYSVSGSYLENSTVGIGLRWAGDDEYYTAHIAGNEYPSPAIAKEKRTKYVKKNTTITYHPGDGTLFTLAFAVWDENLKLWYNNILMLSGDDDDIDDAGDIVFEVGQAIGYIDEILVRKYTEPEPSITLADEEAKYELNGNFTSVAYNSPYSSWENISFNADIPSGSSIKFKIRTAGNQNDLSSKLWYGPILESEYYSSPGKLNVIHNGNNWIQYIAFFDSDGTNTPILNDVTLTSSITNYPSIASIETKDFEISNLLNFDSFQRSELLNSQNISYYYSLDSGNSWNLIADNISSINYSNKKIRLKAILASDGANTPITYDLSISYKTQTCTENWIINHTDCLPNNAIIRYYIDKNECGTKLNLPSDNGSSISCVYDTSPPKLLDFRLSKSVANTGEIIEIKVNAIDENNISLVNVIIGNENKELISNISLSSTNGIIYTGSLNTGNLALGTYLLTPELTDSYGNKIRYPNREILAVSNHAKNTFLNNSVQLIKDERLSLNISHARVLLEISSAKDIANASIAVTEFTNNTRNISPSLPALGKYLDIIIDNTTKQNISSLSIKIYYTAEEVAAAGLDENTLKIYYFNDTSSAWQELYSIVNTTENSVTVTVKHASTYAVFGQQKSSPSSPPIPSGGGSSSEEEDKQTDEEIQSSIDNIKEENKPSTIIENKIHEEEKKTPEIRIQKQECNYDLNVALPGYISFVDNDLIRGFIENSGDCEVKGISLKLSKDLSLYLNISYNDKILGKGISMDFVLKARNISQREQFLTGFIIKEKSKVVKRFTGELLLTAVDQEGNTIERNIPINVDLPVVEEKSPNPTWVIIIAAGMSMLIALFIAMRVKGSRKVKQK